MWSSTITKSGVENENFVVYSTLTNDKDGSTKTKIYEFHLNVSPLDISNQIQADVDGLNNVDILNAAIVPGPFVPITPPEPATPATIPPTDAQVQMAAYFRAMSVRQQIQQAISVGALSPGDALDTASLAAVQGAFALVSPALLAAINNANSTVKAAPAPKAS